MSESITLNEVPTIQMRESKQDCSDNIKYELELFEDQIKYEFEYLRLKTKNLDPTTKTEILKVINRSEKLLLGN